MRKLFESPENKLVVQKLFKSLRSLSAVDNFASTVIRVRKKHEGNRESEQNGLNEKMFILIVPNIPTLVFVRYVKLTLPKTLNQEVDRIISGIIINFFT